MKLSLNKEDLASVLKKHFEQAEGLKIDSVKITPFGENIAEIFFEATPRVVVEKVTDEVG